MQTTLTSGRQIVKNSFTVIVCKTKNSIQVCCKHAGSPDTQTFNFVNPEILRGLKF